MNDQDTAHALAALSARILALEGAVHAISPRSAHDRSHTLAVFDAFAEETLDNFLAKPVDDTVLALIRQSFDDIRTLLSRG